MHKKRYTFETEEFDRLEDLPQKEQDLLKKASEAREHAYAPYSKFKVGAAVLLENQEVVIGSNQENASFPSGLCAERVAVFQAGARFPAVSIQSIAIVAALENSTSGNPAAPCGNCRQSIFEYENKQNKPITMLLMGGNGRVIKCKAIADLLPLAFGSDFLG
ncbi:MAG: cytidine deaminase [Eudoraea sp.]|nr:cytidine deaminase [Eudoraea sp.]MBT8222502.1 cytidine deaminase [Eudoraea sp.]NNK30144.1 cytidine deaminase [Flavobacteriaceae bacterium]